MYPQYLKARMHASWSTSMNIHKENVDKVANKALRTMERQMLHILSSRNECVRTITNVRDVVHFTCCYILATAVRVKLNYTGHDIRQQDNRR